MSTRHLSIRIEQQCFDALEAESQRTRESVSELARRLIDEGLRMEKHPGIVFRSSATGRLPSLTDGPAVWVVARILRDLDVSEGAALDEAVELTSLRPDQVSVVARYYREFKQEIDDWLDRLDSEAERAFAASGRQPLQRAV